MKQCSTCRTEFGPEFFNKDSSKKDSLCSSCRACSKERSKIWTQENQGRLKEYRDDNEVKILAYSRKYYQENKEYYAELHKTEEYREKSRAYNKAYKISTEGRKKHNARQLVRSALKTGKLTKEDCKYPNGKCSGNIEGHHWDYDKPLSVDWFCKKHHVLADKIQKLILKPNLSWA